MRCIGLFVISFKFYGVFSRKFRLVCKKKFLFFFFFFFFFFFQIHSFSKETIFQNLSVFTLCIVNVSQPLFSHKKNKKPFNLSNICTVLFLDLKCGKNMFYWWSAPACPNMCTESNAESTCTLPKTESCRCKHGYVLSGDSCVRKEDCGCSKGSKYFPV